MEKKSDILSKPEGYGLVPPLPDLPQVQERWGVVLHTCTLRRETLRQEDCSEFKINPGNRVRC